MISASSSGVISNEQKHDRRCTPSVNTTVPVDVYDVPIVDISFFHWLIGFPGAYRQRKNVHLQDTKQKIKNKDINTLQIMASSLKNVPSCIET